MYAGLTRRADTRCVKSVRNSKLQSLTMDGLAHYCLIDLPMPILSEGVV
jgi:hypothetical protein